VIIVVEREDVNAVPISSADTQEDFVVGQGRLVWCEVTSCDQVQVRCCCCIDDRVRCSEALMSCVCVTVCMCLAVMLAVITMMRSVDAACVNCVF